MSWNTYYTISVIVGVMVLLHIVGTALHALLGLHLNIADTYNRLGGEYCTRLCKAYVNRHANGFVTLLILITTISVMIISLISKLSN
jgi:hypothetical protein